MQKKNEKRALIAEMLRSGASTRAIVSAAKVSFNVVAEVRRELAQADDSTAISVSDSAIDSIPDSTTDSAINSSANSTAEPVQHSEQSYLSAVRNCISSSAAELLLFRQKHVERNGLIALTRNLADCMGNFTQYLALKGTLETTYSRRANKLLDLLRRALANDPSVINYDIYEAAGMLAEAPLVGTSEKALCADPDLSEVLAYRPAASVRLKEIIPPEKIRLAGAKREAFKIPSLRKGRETVK